MDLSEEDWPPQDRGKILRHSASYLWGMEYQNNCIYFCNFIIFLTKDIIILLFNSVYIILWTSTFYFFNIKWSACLVISAFGINRGFSCLDLKIHNMSRRLVQLRFDLPPGKVRCWSVEWTTGWHNQHSFYTSPLHFYFFFFLSLFTVDDWAIKRKKLQNFPTEWAALYIDITLVRKGLF